jgi:hypothetical protein
MYNCTKLKITIFYSLLTNLFLYACKWIPCILYEGIKGA